MDYPSVCNDETAWFKYIVNLIRMGQCVEIKSNGDIRQYLIRDADDKFNILRRTSSHEPLISYWTTDHNKTIEIKVKTMENRSTM